MKQIISRSDVGKHNRDGDLWVIINDKVYDLTKFSAEHPGGKDIIVKYAGKDATTIFESLHSKDVLNTLPPSTVVGQIDMKEPKPKDEVEAHTSTPKDTTCTIHHMQNVMDFEAVARSVMTKEGWGYYSSGADDEITLRENRIAFQRIWLRPRVMVNVKEINVRTTILGQPSSFPLYVSATAMGKLAHPEGEVNFTRACHSQGVIQMIPTLASCSFDELVDAAQPGQPQFFQLYVNPNRTLTEATVRKAERRGCKGLFITVDAPQLGRREKDLRNKASGASNAQKGMSVDTSKGVSTALSSFIDPALCWDDLKWFRSITKMPIVLKGVQCVEDAVQVVLFVCYLDESLPKMGERTFSSVSLAIFPVADCMCGCVGMWLWVCGCGCVADKIKSVYPAPLSFFRQLFSHFVARLICVAARGLCSPTMEAASWTSLHRPLRYCQR